MKRVVVAAGALLLAGAGEAQAGPASELLGRCLVQSSSGRDRVVFMRWMFSAMAQHPDVSALAKVTPDESVGLAKGAAAVVDRLVLKDCRAEAVAAIRTDGEGAMRAPFETFGRIAMQELMGEPVVSQHMDTVGNLLDAEGWAALDREAKVGKP